MDAPAHLTGLPEGFSARPATWDDVDAVTALVAACEVLHDGVAGVDREDVVADWARGTFDLATDSVVVLAEGAVIAEVDVFLGRMEANVHPDWHGRGVGTWLLAQGERIARGQGCRAPRRPSAIAPRRGRAAAAARLCVWVHLVGAAHRPRPAPARAGASRRHRVPRLRPRRGRPRGLPGDRGRVQRMAPTPAQHVRGLVPDDPGAGELPAVDDAAGRRRVNRRDRGRRERHRPGPRTRDGCSSSRRRPRTGTAGSAGRSCVTR